jgi:hypothetical protein
MVELSFDLAPPGPTVLHQAVDQSLVVLLRGVEVGVLERKPLLIPPAIRHARILPAPVFEPLDLDNSIGMLAGRSREDGRLEVVGQSEDEVDGTGRRGPAAKPLPRICWKPLEAMPSLFPTLHVNFLLGTESARQRSSLMVQCLAI